MDVITDEQWETYIDDNKQTLDMVLEINVAQDWKVVGQEEAIVFLTKQSSVNSFSIIKSIVEIEGTLDECCIVLDSLTDINEKSTEEERSGICFIRIVCQLENDPYKTAIIHAGVESGSRFVANRDFLSITRYYEIEEKRVYLQTSIVNELISKSEPNFVRGTILFKAFILEPHPFNREKIILTFLVHVDPAGSIPAMLYNAAAKKRGYVVSTIQKKVKELRKN